MTKRIVGKPILDRVMEVHAARVVCFQLRASRDGDRTKRRIAITQNGGCRSHKTAHRDHLAQVR